MGLKSQNTWGTHNWVLKVTWVGVALYWGSTPGSGRGHIKVISRSNQLKYWITTFFTVSIIFCCGEVFHKATVDIMWLGSLPTRILVGGGGGVEWLYVAWRGNTPLLYHPSPLISPPVQALTSVQNEVNWSIEEHGLQVTKHLRHPHLDTKGDMGWSCPFLRLYSRVRMRSY